MTEAAVVEITEEDAMKSDFVRELVKQVRAQDSHGVWEKKTDASVLSEFIVDKEKRKTLPIVGDPDPDVLWRLQLFYNAVALLIEKRTGHMAVPMMKMSHEGFGRMILTVGRLLVINKTLRDVHRFGFLNFAKMSDDGEKLVADAISWIEKYEEVAKA